MAAHKPVLLKDVASVAGVSVSIASQVLNGRGRVAPETRARILDAAERLQFRPNALAQSFKNGRSLTIGLLVEQALRLFTMPVVIGAGTALGARELATLVFDASAGAERRSEIVATLRARRVDGVLVVGDGTERTYASLAGQLSVPVVYAFGESNNPADTSFLPDATGAGRLAAEHLVAIGRTRIAHVSSALDRAAAKRATGLAEGLERAGLDLALGAPLLGDWTEGWGREAGSRLLDRPGEVDAVFAGNDRIASGLYSTLRRAGVRVPDDIAIVGYDNVRKLIEDSRPSLTTIDPQLDLLGARAAEQLIAAAEGAPAAGLHELPCVLVPGFSTLGPAVGIDGLDADADISPF